MCRTHVSLLLSLRGAVSERNTEIFEESCARDRAGAAQHGRVHRSAADQRGLLHAAGRAAPSPLDGC